MLPPGSSDMGKDCAICSELWVEAIRGQVERKGNHHHPQPEDGVRQKCEARAFFNHEKTPQETEENLARMPRNRLGRAAGIAPWGVTTKSARGELIQ